MANFETRLRCPQPKSLQEFLGSGLTAALGKTVLAPIGRVKIILQVQRETPTILSNGLYKDFRVCVRRIISDQGWLALWRGNSANVIRYFPGQGMNLLCRDFYKRLFNPFE